jgi:hypothetical protein
VVIAYFKVLSQHFAGEVEVKPQKSQLTGPQAGFELCTA